MGGGRKICDPQKMDEWVELKVHLRADYSTRTLTLTKDLMTI